MAAKNSVKVSKKNKFNDYVSEPQEEQESWWANGLHRFIIVFSVMWFAIVAVYMTKFFGWNNLFSMLPNEFSAYMAGITLPLAIMWVIMAYIDRGSSFRNETRMLRNSLNQVIFPDSNGSEATKMIADAIKAQVADLKEVTRDVCAQGDVIKRDLTERVTELKELAEMLDKYASQTMMQLNDEIAKMVDNFNFVAEKATAATADFRVNTLQMKDDSENIVNLLTPMVNEMVTAAERVKEVVNVNNENISRAQEQLNKYSDSSQLAIGRIIESWSEKGENLQNTFLRTSENCEELFRRLDSGISHIENSIKEQKTVVETQSSLIDKNSGYLDKKLGEYGRLISLEVEAMVERSGTLEKNLQTQMKTIREMSDQVSEVFVKFGEDLSGKRKLMENESEQVLQNISKTVNSLNNEVKRLQDFYNSTQDTNGEFSKVFNMVAHNLKEIESGLNKNVADFNNTATGIFGKFNEIGQLVSSNIDKMKESSDNLSTQSKQNAELLIEQDASMNKSATELKQMTAQITSLNKNVAACSKELQSTLDNYTGKIDKFESSINNHLENLRNGFGETEKQIDAFNKKYMAVGLNSFMKNSSDIINELQSISIDINGIFNKSGKDDELWKKYYEGDHAVFARYLAKNMTKKEVVAIRDDYEKKTDFRIIVDKYLSDFERLVAAARENEYASILLALISGSDVGKVYYILARAVGKIN